MTKTLDTMFLTEKKWSSLREEETRGFALCRNREGPLPYGWTNRQKLIFSLITRAGLVYTI